MGDRSDRRHEVGPKDQRDDFQRDRDRVLYSSAFRRLSGVTQIVRAGEADVFHTRQQHTLKVAQVGRRLAEQLIAKNPAECKALGVGAEVVEAASLMHDLGHPPFGHVGEHTLNRLVENAGDTDGFEGNAQSFRIVTKLAVHFEKYPGLDLCRATLAACLKYPWLRDQSNPSRRGKWGAYKIDEQDFLFAIEGLRDGARSAEAEIMDWADDISYSVHDLEDFHRCGAIPWRQVLGSHTDQIIDTAVNTWFNAPPDAVGRLKRAMERLNVFFERRLYNAVIEEPYEGTRDQRRQLRTMTSQLIARYITSTNITMPSESLTSALDVPDTYLDEVKLLKQITKNYVINNPTLIAQQKGHERIIRSLFHTLYRGTTKNSCPSYLPRRLEYLWDKNISKARFVSDCIASLTEAEAVGLWGRLQGRASGSVLDPIVR